MEEKQSMEFASSDKSTVESFRTKYVESVFYDTDSEKILFHMRSGKVFEHFIKDPLDAAKYIKVVQFNNDAWITIYSEKMQKSEIHIPFRRAANHAMPPE